MKKFAIICACAFFWSACTKQDVKQEVAITKSEVTAKLSQSELDQIIFDELQHTGSFDWNNMPIHVLWNAMQLSNDFTLSVGYRPEWESGIENKMHLININENSWKSVKEDLLQIIWQEERKINPSLSLSKLEKWQEKVLPVINVEIHNINTLTMLRKLKTVRYAEPIGYDPISRNYGPESGGSGCGGYTPDNSLQAGKDYSVTEPNAKVSWNYDDHGIQSAWTRTSGAGIKIMILDTGLDPDQSNLGADFNQGASQGRSLEKMTTLPNSNNINDFCGHGTTMAGAAAAPRCNNGNAVGVAYNCNLVSCKTNEDVYIDDGPEVKAVSDAYIWGADNATVRIISMSNGRLTRANQIVDAIRYAYGKGKLMFCAAGTSTDITAIFYGVIFPATMDEVNAITGIEEQTNSGMYRCDACHSGKPVDFVIVMEQKNTNLHALVPGVFGNQPTTVGGSSVATATAAGIAALVWSKYPTWTRDQVQQRLTQTASSYPNKKRNLGYGTLNADLATN